MGQKAVNGTVGRMNCIFFGTPEFSAIHLRALIKVPDIRVSVVVTNPDRPAGRGGKVTASPVKLVANEFDIPVVQPNSIKKDVQGFLRSIEAFGPFDIGVVVAFGMILPIEVLHLPKGGSVNVHASLLPRWRGAAPIQRAIMAGDTETGVCLMQMDAGLDTGSVYVARKIPVTPEDTSGSLHSKLSELGASVLAEYIHPIATGDITPTPQSDIGIVYAHKITNDEARISWNDSHFQVCRKIHGLSPAPGAYTTYNGQRIKIFAAREVPGSASSHPPGEIITASGYDLRVACHDGILALLELQLEGKKRMPVEEFLKSGLLTPNTSFE